MYVYSFWLTREADSNPLLVKYGNKSITAFFTRYILPRCSILPILQMLMVVLNGSDDA